MSLLEAVEIITMNIVNSRLLDFGVSPVLVGFLRVHIVMIIVLLW